MIDRKHVCPWWFCYTFDNPFRKLFHRPDRMFAAMIRPGMTVADIGCGMGYFTIGLAQLVGSTGRVLAVDLQSEMLVRVARRARKAGVSSVVETRLCQSDSLDIDEAVDFVLAFWMVHETPDPQMFFKQVREILKPGGRMLVTEPKFHVSDWAFEEELEMAEAAMLAVKGRPDAALSKAALLEAV
jgi:ubiquinone/menaquinone biosynthesis C-methylase UbiE